MGRLIVLLTTEPKYHKNYNYICFLIKARAIANDLIQRYFFFDFDGTANAALDVIVKLLERFRNEAKSARNIGTENSCS